MRSRLLAVGLALSLFAPTAASANGRFPYANQLVVSPKDPKHLALRTTYGFVQSFDDGATWNWLCERSVGYGGTFDPAIGVTGTDSIIVGLFDGLSYTADRGCNWQRTPGVLDKQFVIDVAVQKDDPMRAIAMTSSGLGDAGFNVILAETTDGGATWAQLGVALPRDLNSETVDVAPSDPKRIYASGVIGTSPRKGVLERSDDRGASWTRVEIDLAGGRAPFIAAVHPTNADVLYVRVANDTPTSETGVAEDRLLLSTDGGKSFREVARSNGAMLGFALSPDGNRVAFGSTTDGLMVASTGDHAFKRTASVGVRCLTWSRDGLFVCGTEYPDNFTVAFTRDEGKTLETRYRLSHLSELACPPSSSTGTTCPADWQKVRDTIGTPDDAAAPPVDSARDGGAAARPGEATEGCGCSVPRGGPSLAAFAMALGAAVAIARNLRRRS
jgi:photosystem II stability/assembly factor-like uncharacterized protein